MIFGALCQHIGGAKGSAGGDTRQHALGAGKETCGVIGLGLRDGDDLIHQRSIVVLGHEVGTDALQTVGTGFAAGEQAILEVSLAVGFHNLSYFYRAFREKYGLTPREFIRQCGAKNDAASPGETAP